MATIIIEDNGIGIPSGKKEMIFTRKEYHDTSLGLFLSREILALTGFAILETGIPGQEPGLRSVYQKARIGF
jgi:signal transduction histidine kinase